MKPIFRALGARHHIHRRWRPGKKLDGAEHYTIPQTLLFFAAQTTGLHLDSWALDTAPVISPHTLNHRFRT